MMKFFNNIQLSKQLSNVWKLYSSLKEYIIIGTHLIPLKSLPNAVVMNEIDILYLLLLIVISKLKRIGITISLYNKSNDHGVKKKEGKKSNTKNWELFLCNFFFSASLCRYLYLTYSLANLTSTLCKRTWKYLLSAIYIIKVNMYVKFMFPEKLSKKIFYYLVYYSAY